jgi:branched-chain amino acid transport system substrate-binding protein
MLNIRRSVIGALCLGLAGIFSGLSLPAAAQEQAPVRIGFSMSKTGLFAAATPAQLNAYNMWRDQVNAKGGLNVGGVKRKIEFVEYDDQSNGATAVKIYEKLITDDKVDLLLTPWGTVTHFAIVPVLERFGFPAIGSTASSVLVRDLKVQNLWFVSPSVHDKLAAQAAAMAKDQKVTRAAIIGSVLPQGKEIKKYLVPALEAAGIKIVLSEEYPPDIKDMTALLSRVKAANPEAVFVLSYPADSILYTRQAKEIGITAPFQWLAIGPTIPAYRKIFGPSANGIVSMGHWSPEQSHWPRAKPFYEAYVERFKEEPDYLDTVLAYMSCEILEEAVAEAGLDKAKLRAVINAKTFDTINGPVKFDGVGNATTPVAFLQIQDGKFQIVWPEQIATAKAQPKTSW